MIKLKSRILSFAAAAAMTFGCVVVSEPVKAQAKDISGYSAADIAKDMGLGWNLGNALDAHDAKSSGLDTETSWGNPKATEDLIKAVKAKGFDTIRVPVTWYKHMDSNYKVDSAWMARVKTVVDYGIDNDMYVILNVHHDEWNRPTDGNYASASKELKTLWEQIANEFKGYDKHLIFEGMNEPRNYNGEHEWDGGTDSMRNVVNKLNADFVSTVRATGGNNKTRALMVPTYAASMDTAAMQAWTRPNNDSNIIASIHAYTPYEFTMDGHTSFDDNMKNQLNNFFTQMNSIFLQKGVPVCIGEFSASNYNNTSERVKWAEFYATKAKQLNVPIVLWDNNIPSDNGGEAHGYINRSTLQWYSDSDAVVKKLVSAYGNTEKTPSNPSKGKNITIAEGSYTASNYDPSSKISFDPSIMSSKGYIAVTYDTSKAVPWIVIQDNGFKVWAKVSPTKTSGDVAYFSYDDMVNSYAKDYKNQYSKSPSGALSGATGLFIWGEGNSVSASKIAYVEEGSSQPSQPTKPNGPVDIKDCNVSFTDLRFAYDGKAKTTSVLVSYKGYAFKQGEDYTVSYSNNVNIGKGTITVKGNGKTVTGSMTQTIVIVDPAKCPLGDVDLDGVITITDAVAVISHINGISPLNGKCFTNGDVDKSGNIDISDAVIIINHINGVAPIKG